MRYRSLDAAGDYTLGNSTVFLVNSPATVGQSVLTRLRLLTGEFFLDLTEGLPYSTEIRGKYTQATYDAAIRSRILGTQGITEITAYQSTLSSARVLTVTVSINTVYGPTEVATTL